MTCKDCPDSVESINTSWFKCPYCNWIQPTGKNDCLHCIDKHLEKHGVKVDTPAQDPSMREMLNWYGKKYNKHFETVEDLDTYILLNNISNK